MNKFLSAIMAVGFCYSTAFACEKCCCDSAGGATLARPIAFSTSCYTGDGNDDRKIVTGIPSAKAGLLRICEKTAQAGNNNECRWKIPQMPGEEACIWVGSSQRCESNYIQSFGEQYFVLGNGSTDPVNASGRPFCYEQWTLSPQHNTFTYTGDGTANRHINTTTPGGASVQPDWVFLMDKNNSVSGADGVYSRQKNMPANTSCRALASVTCNTDMIRNFDSTGFTVGAVQGNISGHTYYGGWFKEKSGYIETTNYTGTSGTNGGACTSGGDASRDMTASSCAEIYDWWGQTDNIGRLCTSGVSNVGSWWRSVAVGLTVPGPGGLTGSDKYAFQSSQPNNSGPGVLNNFDDHNNTITLDKNGLNELGEGNYALITCAGSMSPGSVSAPDWSAPAPNTIVAYHLEEATGTTRRNNDCGLASPSSGGTVGCTAPSCNCNLTDAGGVVQDTTNKVVGAASASFAAASSQYLSVSATELNSFGTSGNSVTWGGFVWATNDEDITYLSKGGAQTNVMRLSRGASSDNMICQHRSSAGATTTKATSTNSFTTGAWHFAACVFDNTANTLAGYFDGTLTTTVAVTTDMGNAAGTFGIAGYDNAAGGSVGTGKLDESFVYAGAITSTDLCRICSCGFNGSLCSCFSGDQTLYVSTGRNLSSCGSCTLPVCNESQPA